MITQSRPGENAIPPSGAEARAIYQLARLGTAAARSQPAFKRQQTPRLRVIRGLTFLFSGIEVPPLQIQIEKLVYGGDGLARMPADDQGRGKTVFVPFVLPGEQVEVAVIESRSGFARAKLDTVLTPSADRIAPGCPYFGGCGGCHYQHVNYEAQLRHKADILRETLRRTAKLELQHEIQLHPSPPWNYRNRTRMHVRHTPEFALGYYRHNSRDVLPVESCPISSALINRAIAAVWALGREKAVPESAARLAILRQPR